MNCFISFIEIKCWFIAETKRKGHTDLFIDRQRKKIGSFELA